MNPTHAHLRRPGHSLIELVAAMVCGSILLAGLGAVMFIARQTAYTPTASVQRIDAAQVVNELADDLRHATLVIEHSPRVLEFVVADRSGDGTAERIRYEWSGTAGDPLYRTLNGGDAVEVAGPVQDFHCTLVTEEKTVTYTTTTDTAEAVLQSNPIEQSGDDRDITIQYFLSQEINPATFTAVPGAIAWNATRIDFFGRQSGTATERLLVQLRAAGSPYGSPTSQVVGQATISMTDSGMAWRTTTFLNPVRGLSLDRKYAITWSRNNSGGTAQLRVNNSASSGVSESSSGASWPAGALWQFLPGHQVFYRFYGTYTLPGPSYDVTRTYVSRLELMLQTAEASHSRIDSKIPLRNRPELLSAYWRADFDADPTAIDVDGDGVADWAMAGGGSFDPDALEDGVWQASGALQSRPQNNFTQTTTIDVRCRNTTQGGNGAVVRINANRNGGFHAPILVRLQRQADDTQTLTLLGKPSETATTTLAVRPRLPAGFVRVRLTVVPNHGLVNLHINDEDQGAFSYPPPYAPPAGSNERFVTLFADGSDAEFDSIEVRVGRSD